jgi:hypothetical protein
MKIVQQEKNQNTLSISAIVMNLKNVFSTKFIQGLFSSHNESSPLQFSRVTERFDVVKKLHYKGWILRQDNEQ